MRVAAATHSLHVENRRLHKVLAKVVNNEGGDAQGDTVLTQRAHYQHLLKLIAVKVPIIYERKNNKLGNVGIWESRLEVIRQDVSLT